MISKIYTDCPKCDASTDFLLDLGSQDEDLLGPTLLRCPECRVVFAVQVKKIEVSFEVFTLDLKRTGEEKSTIL